MLIDFISLVIIFFVTCYIFKKFYKKCEDTFEKVIFWIYIVLTAFILTLYYFDKFNVPTFLKWGENVDTQNWLTILANFGTAILAEVLGGLFLIYVTMIQIKKNNDDNRNRDKEERRINNMPLLTYTFSSDNKGIINRYNLPSIYKYSNGAEIVLIIKNIGLNAVRNCYIKISGKSLEKSYYCQLDTQNTLDKGEDKAIEFLIALPFEKHDFKITVYYEDLLHNWYSQVINLNCEVIFIFYQVSNYINYRFSVENEKVIKKPRIKINALKY